MTNSANELTHLNYDELMGLLKSTIYSVEKFQGSDRDLIITSIGLSDEDKISKEEDFIYNLNRFNVLTSRAKCKIIFISSNQFLQYIPEERKALENASKVYLYAEDFCNKTMNLTVKNEKNENEEIIFKFKG
jgi:superfamily I DNA and/or RNA helicase